jgi:hypothetical protein
MVCFVFLSDFQLQRGEFVDTKTSMKENIGQFVPHALQSQPSLQVLLSHFKSSVCTECFIYSHPIGSHRAWPHPRLQGKDLEFVDFPGHGSQRHRLATYFASARAVVLVIDAVNLNGLQDAALYAQCDTTPCSASHVHLIC